MCFDKEWIIQSSILSCAYVPSYEILRQGIWCDGFLLPVTSPLIFDEPIVMSSSSMEFIKYTKFPFF